VIILKETFKDRLYEYRRFLNIKTKRAMAERLGVKESLYNMLEKGSREPSKDILIKLYLDSGRPEEYWMYGIDIENEYISSRNEFKSTRETIDQLINLGLLDENSCTDAAKEVLIAAVLVDAKHIALKRKEENKK
jgi:transcriptional regulator with XRE-family HTH domain